MMDKGRLIQLLKDVESELTSVYFQEEIYTLIQLSNYFEASTIKSNVRQFIKLTHYILDAIEALNIDSSYAVVANCIFAELEIGYLDLKDLTDLLEFSKIKSTISKYLD